MNEEFFKIVDGKVLIDPKVFPFLKSGGKVTWPANTFPYLIVGDVEINGVWMDGFIWLHSVEIQGNLCFKKAQVRGNLDLTGVRANILTLEDSQVTGAVILGGATFSNVQKKNFRCPNPWPQEGLKLAA